MIRGVSYTLLCLLAASGIGCAMCCGPDMYTYPTFGGRVQRSDMEYGRVGSIYSDPTAGEISGELQMQPTTVPANENQTPTPAVELERPQTESRQAPVQDNALRSKRGDGWR